MLIAIELLEELRQMLEWSLRRTFWPVFLCLFALWLIRPGGTSLQVRLRRRYVAIFVVANLAQLHLAVRAAGWPYGWEWSSGFSHLLDWPTWLPLLAIAMFASTRAFGAGAAYRRAILLLPHSGGHCVDCGHPGVNEKCLECGATRIPEKPPWSWGPSAAALFLCGLAVLGPDLGRMVFDDGDASSPLVWALSGLLLLLFVGFVWAIREYGRTVKVDGREGPPPT